MRAFLLSLLLLPAAPASGGDILPFLHRSSPGGWGVGATLTDSFLSAEFKGFVFDFGPSITVATNEAGDLAAAEGRLYCVKVLSENLNVFGFAGGGVTLVQSNSFATFSVGAGAGWRRLFVDLSRYQSRDAVTTDFRFGWKIHF